MAAQNIFEKKRRVNRKEGYKNCRNMGNRVPYSEGENPAPPGGTWERGTLPVKKSCPVASVVRSEAFFSL